MHVSILSTPSSFYDDGVEKEEMALFLGCTMSSASAEKRLLDAMFKTTTRIGKVTSAWQSESSVQRDHVVVAAEVGNDVQEGEVPLVLL